MVTLWIALIVFAIITIASHNKSTRAISSLRERINDLEEKIQKQGNFSVRLEKVDEDKKDLLTTAISIITDFDKAIVKKMVDAVHFGSMPIIVENVSEEYANQVKQVIENHGGTAVVVKK